MQSDIVFLLLALVVQAHANELVIGDTFVATKNMFYDKLINLLTDKLFERAIKALSTHHMYSGRTEIQKFHPHTTGIDLSRKSGVRQQVGSTRVTVGAGIASRRAHVPLCQPIFARSHLTSPRSLHRLGFRRHGLTMRCTLSGSQRDIQRNLTEIRLRHTESVLAALERFAPTIFAGLSTKGYAVVDDFLNAETILVMREEANALHRSSRTTPSLTETGFDDGSVEIIAKPGVFLYDRLFQKDIEPFLHGFSEVLKSYLPDLFNAKFPEVTLSNYLYATHLAVYSGEGSEFPLHVDKYGETDCRKLTTILYLQSNWTTEQGGCFRIFERRHPDDIENLETADLGAYVDIAPIGGRLITFWSDIMPHSVQPTHVQSEKFHRWALTTWFPCDNGWFRLERAQEDWNLLYDETQARHPYFTEDQAIQSVDAAFARKFGCTLSDRQEDIKRRYGLH